MSTTITTLPSEIVERIVDFLDTRDQGSFKCTKELNIIVSKWQTHTRVLHKKPLHKDLKNKLHQPLSMEEIERDILLNQLVNSATRMFSSHKSQDRNYWAQRQETIHCKLLKLK